MLCSADGVIVPTSDGARARFAPVMAADGSVPYSTDTVRAIVAFHDTASLAAVDSAAALAAVAEASIALEYDELTKAVCDQFHEEISGRDCMGLADWIKQS
jgi:hypothetical protein